MPTKEKIIVFGIMFALIFVLLLVSSKKANPPAYVPQGRYWNHIGVPEPLPEVEKPDEEVEPELKTPCDGMILPKAAIYNYNSNTGEIKKTTNAVKSVYLQCVILKALTYENQKYYLVKVTEKGFTSDIWVLKETSVIVL